MDYTPGDITKAPDQHPSRQLLVRERQQRLLGKTPNQELNELYTEKHECIDDLALLKEKTDFEKSDTPHVLGTGIPDNLESIRAIAPLETGVPSDDIPQQQVEEITNSKMRLERPVAEKPTERNVPEPIVPAFCNFMTARKMAQENLEHQPLPDAVMDLGKCYV